MIGSEENCTTVNAYGASGGLYVIPQFDGIHLHVSGHLQQITRGMARHSSQVGGRLSDATELDFVA
jgi:hypothetical protein